MKIILFDACGTITKTNNTYDYINFVLFKKNIARYICFRLYVVSILLLINVGFKSLDPVFRKSTVKFLKGFSVYILDELAKEYIEEVVKQERVKVEMVNIIKQSIRDNNKVIIVSASIEPPIKALALHFGVEEYFATQIGYDNYNCCSGIITTDLLDNKTNAIVRIGRTHDLKNAVLFTDNTGDLCLSPLLKRIYFLAFGRDNWRSWPNVEALVIKDTLHQHDENSITLKNQKLVYIPTMYYNLSRFHLKGVVSLVMYLMLPLSIILIYVIRTDLLATNVVSLIVLGFFSFFSVYEIGGVINDTRATSEGKIGTKRIDKDVIINLPIFLGIRILFTALVIFLLQSYGVAWAIVYLVLLSLVLVIYVIHSTIRMYRWITFLFLKIFRAFLPLFLFLPVIGVKAYLELGVAVLFVDFFQRFFLYIRRKEIVLRFPRERTVDLVVIFIYLSVFMFTGFFPLLILALAAIAAAIIPKFCRIINKYNFPFVTWRVL